VVTSLATDDTDPASGEAVEVTTGGKDSPHPADAISTTVPKTING
jgi:hypothetical protein